MKNQLALGSLALLAFALMETPSRAVEQAEIDFAINKGVQALRSFQNADGIFPHHRIGATALGGLTLLECLGEKDDKDVVRAAESVRKIAPRVTDTYSISLSVVFLDRLGNPDDTPLIEALMVRLLAGQGGDGGWSYECPSHSEDDMRRLEAKVKERKDEGGRREAAKPDAKRKPSDLAPETREQLERVGRGEFGQAGPRGFTKPGPGGQPLVMGTGASDNSNTQFATLALWVGRRHGLPIEGALIRLDRRFRRSQLEDGGWPYSTPMGDPKGMPANMQQMMRGMGSTAAMTCAGVFALTVADGLTMEIRRERNPDAKVPNINDDNNLKRGLEAVGAVIDNPKGLKLVQGQQRFGPPQPERGVGGRTYYFLWSLERMATALDLKTIGKKDWYGWGAEMLMENQRADGAWMGEYGVGGIDTCFALLFLKRSNLVGDLTKQLRGKVMDPGERVLRGGIGGGGLGRKKSMQGGVETLIAKPVAREANPESAKLADSVLKASGDKQLELLEKMESEKGTKYTEALAFLIPKLEGEALKKARQALADRLTRMKDETLTEYLQDENGEIRRAAAIAIGQKESKDLVPNLIVALRDPENNVARAAHASLKSLTRQDFGPAAKATREERDQAALKWIDWLSKQRKKSTRQ